jgi:O-antigen ligase
VRWLPTLIALLLAAAGAAALLSEQLLLMLPVLVVGAMLLPFASSLSVVFMGLLLAFCSAMSQIPIPMPGFRLYGSDGILFFFAAAALVWLWRGAAGLPAPQWRRAEKAAVAILAVMAAYGFVSLFRGAVLGDFPLNDVLGDYRRLMFYPCALIVPLVLRYRLAHLRGLQWAIVVSAPILILIGLYRLHTNQSWQEENFVNEYNNEPRWVGSTECVALEMSLAFLVLQVRTAPSWMWRIAALALAVLSAGMLCIAGWRLHILLAFFVPMAALALFMWIRRESFVGLIRLAVVGLMFAGLTAGILAFVFPEQVHNVRVRMIERQQKDAIRGDLRPINWATAISEGWESSPLMGTGLGHQLFVFGQTSDGAFEGRYVTTHNIWVDMLYQTGLIGFVLFFGLHVLLTLYFLRRVRLIPKEFQPLAAALFMGYAVSMGAHSIEPFEVAGVVWLYLALGFLLVLLRMDAGRQEPDADAPMGAAAPAPAASPKA